MKRYYYKSLDGKGFYNFKTRLSEKEIEEMNVVEITEEEFNKLTAIPEPTKAQKEEAERLSQIASLKSQLASTDYQAIKYAEGWISEEDYAPIKAERQSIRDQINELEG